MLLAWLMSAPLSGAALRCRTCTSYIACFVPGVQFHADEEVAAPKAIVSATDASSHMIDYRNWMAACAGGGTGISISGFGWMGVGWVY